MNRLINILVTDQLKNKMEKDSFEWRNGGKKFEVGDKEDGNMSAIVDAGGMLLCVMRKSIVSIRLADDIDPKRTNSKLPDTQQKVLSYGSDEPFVARTLLQADELFKGNFLSKKFSTLQGRKIAWSLVKEIASLHEITVEFSKDESEINSSFSGKTGTDSSLRVPSMDRVEQRTKNFIINADHAVRHIMELSQAFYPGLPSEKWTLHLYDELKRQVGADHPATVFVESIKLWVWMMRNLRNAVEHPKTGDKVEILDYRLTEKGAVVPPAIQYKNNETPLTEIPVSVFMISTVENLQLTFELLLAHLCNINIDSNVGEFLCVAEIPVTKREPNKIHVRFQFVM